jgi:hypothetical protein
MYFGIDQEVLAVGIDPAHLGLRMPAGHKRSNGCIVRHTCQIENGRMKLRIVRAGRHLSTSLFGFAGP